MPPSGMLDALDITDAPSPSSADRWRGPDELIFGDASTGTYLRIGLLRT